MEIPPGNWGGKDPDPLGSHHEGIQRGNPPGKSGFGVGSVEIFPGIGRGESRVHKEVPPAGGGRLESYRRPPRTTRPHGKPAGNGGEGKNHSMQRRSYGKNPKSLSQSLHVPPCGAHLIQAVHLLRGIHDLPAARTVGVHGGKLAWRKGEKNKKITPTLLRRLLFLPLSRRPRCRDFK